MTASKYQEIAAKKRTQRDSKLISQWLIPEDKLPGPESKDVLNWPSKSGYLSAKEIEMTESSLLEISEKIRSKAWTSYDVTSAFCHRASIAHQLVNCLSEVFFEEGLQQAKELDEFYEKNWSVEGPMHGLPISLKDNLNVKGQATTIGFVGFSFQPQKFEEDSVLVSILRRMGAVFCFKTNVPVAMMMPETINHIYGNTVNPFNRTVTSGGSSGGECALGPLLGSCYCGVGSDIGGSLRIPASMQNLFTLRPSSGRFATYGARSGLPGLESVSSVNGPISTRLENLEFYCKTVINEGKPWLHDPKCLEIPWRDIDLPRKLTFAVLEDDGVVKPYPGITRGLRNVLEQLKSNGHEVIEWGAFTSRQASATDYNFLLSDGGTHCKDYAALTGESFFPYMEMYNSTQQLNVSELWDLHAERTKLCKEYLEMWNKSAEKTASGNTIDAIIMPVSPYSGVSCGKFKYVGYTSVFNALDWAAGTVPVSRVDKRIDTKEENYKPKNALDRETYENYIAEDVEGCAISFKLSAKKLQEEKCVQLMKIVAEAAGTLEYWKKHDYKNDISKGFVYYYLVLVHNLITLIGNRISVQFVRLFVTYKLLIT